MAWFLSQQWSIPVNSAKTLLQGEKKSLQRREMNTSPLVAFDPGDTAI